MTPVATMSIYKGSEPALRALPPVRSLSGSTATVAGSTVAVADDFAVLARADAALAVELEQIAACRTPVCAATVRRLEQLLAVMHDGACARGRLQRQDPDALRTGSALWLARRAQDQPQRSGHVAL